MKLTTLHCRTLLRVALLSTLLGTVLTACSGAKPDAQASAASRVLSFAVLGDAEPKPEPQFPNVAAAVADVNQLAGPLQLDFVIGVGDIAHKGTQVQYDNVTPVLQQLSLPFYPIMGNEEHGSTVARFMHYANLWNQGKVTLTEPSYVLEFDTVALVFASPDHGRDFNDSGIAWIKQQISQLQPKPVLLIVHGAQAGVYPENPDKGIHHPGFADIITQPNLAAVISGDLHMDMDRVQHSKQLGKVHYLHIPALERTKIPDETQHTAMFRVFSIDSNGLVQVGTYQTGVNQPLAQHAYQFSLYGSE